MYVDTSTIRKNGNVYHRHLLRQSYRENGKVKKRTAANLSSCSNQEIKAIKLALRHKGDLTNLGSVKDSLEIESGLSIGAVTTVYQTAVRLGIVRALGPTHEGKLALWQVIARVIDQGSRLSAVRLATGHGACEILGIQKGFNEDDLYKNLGWLNKRQIRIEDQLHRRLKKEKEKEKEKENTKEKEEEQLYLYDVTSSYFEGAENELGAFGYNRDGKKGKQQIVIGLMCDGEGEPVSVDVYPGNTSDVMTFGDQVEKAVKRFDAKRVTFVGDRGMIKGPQIEEIKKENFHYISAISKPQIERMLKMGTFQMSLFDVDLAEIETQDKTRYILRRNPMRADEIEFTRKSKTASVEKEVRKQNEYLSTHPRAKVETAIRKVESKLESLKLKWLSVEEKERVLTIQTDKELLAENRKLDGCYVIKTNLPKEAASKHLVHKRYKDLAFVETAFRSSKTGHLQVRPIFVRREENTRAHVFIVMLAYKIIRELASCWRELNITTEEALNSLTTISAQKITITKPDKTKVTFNQVPKPNAVLRSILESAKITLPEVLPERKVIVDTRKKLQLSRKHQ